MELDAMARNIRRDIIEATFRAGKNGAHVGGALSAAEIFAVLYGKLLRHDPLRPEWPERDRVLLSKGHTAIGLYAALHQAGYLTDEEFYSFEADGGDYPAHCVMRREKGIELSSGSLGLGLSFGIGTALAAKKKGSPSLVYVVMGNGECNEGSVWEAASMAAQLKLDNLIAIVDDNEMQLDGNSKAILDMCNLCARFEAFGWVAWDVNGHNTDALLAAMCESKRGGRPMAIIAHTTKGKGVSFMENEKKWHHASLDEAQYKAAMQELEAKA